MSVLKFCNSDTVKPPKIAIVGAGIGGTSTAYFISQLIPNAEITIFDKSKVGGRLAVVEVEGRSYETGGAIIHTANKYMVEYLNLCGLTMREKASDETFSLHRNGELVFQEGAYSLVDKFRMAWKYGLWNLLKLENFFSTVLSSFLTIYEKLEKQVRFSSVKELLDGMDNVDKYTMESLSHNSLKAVLSEIGLEGKVIEELVTVATKFNYGQMPSTVHALVGSIGLIGFDKKLWAVNGGNYKVAQCALRKSKAKLIQGEVQEVSSENGLFTLKYVQKDSSVTVSDQFNIVVIASPLTADNSVMKLESISDTFPGSYHTTIATIVRGELVPEEAGYKNQDFVVTPNNFYLSDDYPMWSIEKLTPVDYNLPEDVDLPPVYRIFSVKPLSDNQLNTLFTNVTSVVVTKWLAYPSYTLEDDLTSFELMPGLYYTSRIEWAASAMEMSVISAKNVANLVSEFWNVTMDRPNAPNMKTEL